MRTENSNWVQNHKNLLNSYVRKQTNDFDQRNFLKSLLLDYTNANKTRTILEDFRKSNSQKVEEFINKFVFKSQIAVLIADRGQGKTLGLIWLAEQLDKKGKKIYALFPFPPLPFVTIVYDLSEVPSNSIVLIDELAKTYKARDFSSEDAIAMTDELIGLRHNDISVIGGTQDTSLIDINLLRLCDIQMWKYYNMDKGALTREGLISELALELMPEQDSLTNLLVIDRGRYSTFKHNFPENDSQSLSKYLSQFRKPEKKQEIIDFLKKYHKEKDIPKILHTKYNIRLTIEEQKTYLNL